MQRSAVTNTSKAVLSHCSKHFLSPLTKPHNIADFGESSWEETFLSGPGYTLLDSHQLTATTAEMHGGEVLVRPLKPERQRLARD